jgi:hypothetical protein
VDVGATMCKLQRLAVILRHPSAIEIH